jgi:hypothetical protein
MIRVKLHTPENNPKENIRHSKHGENMKSRIPLRLLIFMVGIVKSSGSGLQQLETWHFIVG